MFDHEEIIRRKEKKKKILIIAVCVVAGMFLLFGIATLILSGVQNNIRNQAREQLEKDIRRTYVYPDPDYNFNIFEDEGYLELDRNIWYTDGNLRTVITEENKNTYEPELQFMYEMIHLIKNGDYVGYNNLFTEEYLLTAGDDLRERFTMQQIFDIELEYMNRREAGSVIHFDIRLIYKIRNNNGTFRNDLDYNDHGAIPVIYMLVIDREGEIKIDNLLTQRRYLSGLY